MLNLLITSAKKVLVLLFLVLLVVLSDCQIYMSILLKVCHGPKNN